jgi:hypothetical protein
MVVAFFRVDFKRKLQDVFDLKLGICLPVGTGDFLFLASF